MIRSRHLSLARNNVQGKIFHSRVQDFLHRTGQAVHFVDKEHIPRV